MTQSQLFEVYWSPVSTPGPETSGATPTLVTLATGAGNWLMRQFENKDFLLSFDYFQPGKNAR